jgi:RNA polymerase sigma-70 factor
MTVTATRLESVLGECSALIDELYSRCRESYPNYKVTKEEFVSSLRAGAEKYLVRSTESIQGDELRNFLNELQINDLYLAIACAKGDEAAWWDFDSGYRRYIERVARHLAKAENLADEIVDLVYTELYGTRVVEGVRQSKFASFSGRGTLKGWLRAIVWHALVDMHRARQDEISIDEWTETGGESTDRPGWRAETHMTDRVMVEEITRDRYKEIAQRSLNISFGKLEDHEKLLLLYYHVEGLRLREIARLVEEPQSPLRSWFQRQSRQRKSAPASRVHESTVMRWLEKVYVRILESFGEQLKDAGLNPEEMEICTRLASEDLAINNLRTEKDSSTPLGKSKGI